MEKSDEDKPSFGATPTDWRVSNLKYAYQGILDDEAFEYELGRFQGLQEVKRQKMAAAAAIYSYDASLQNFMRVLLCWASFTHVFFRLQAFISFLLARLFVKNADIPPLRWPFELWDCWLMRRLLLSPSLFMLLAATYFGLNVLWRRMWIKYRALLLMAVGGCIVIFVLLILG